MSAVRWHGVRDIRFEKVPAPSDPPPGSAVIAVSKCGICGTDVGEYRAGPFLIRESEHPLSGHKPPVTLGHELSGSVVAVGEGVEDLVGSRVTVDACWRCGTCAACKEGNYHLCRYGGSIGLVSDGGFAPYLTVPAYTLVEVPDSVGDEWAALSEPLAVGLHALDRGGARPGDDVLVLGFGPIGAGVALIARALGMMPIVVEASPQRLAAASEMGLRAIEPSEELPRLLRKMLKRHGVRVAIECTGVPEVLAQSIHCVDRGGSIVPIGLTKSPTSIDPASLVLYERTLAGSLGYRYDLPRVVSLMASGTLDPTPLISEVVALDQVPGTIARLAEAPGATIKAIADVSG